MDLVRFGAAVNALLDSLDDRLFDDTRESVRTYLWTGEEGLAADELAGVLTGVPITPTERDLLREVLYAFDVDGHEDEFRHLPSLSDRERVLAALNVVSDPPAPSPSPPPRSPDR
ncbi:MAG TPA: hypothetical protein VJT79_01850 [Pseudonocardia sp.]|nr:hypothetical protein [Pseudonocardia sp.]